MRVTRIIVGNSSENTKVLIDDSYVLEGVKALTFHQDANMPPVVVLQLEGIDVEIDRFV